MERVVSLNMSQLDAAVDMTLARWQHGGKWFYYGEHAIFSRIGGAGDAVLLLHGFPTASWDWSRIWALLCQQHQVLVADMLGFGFSDKPKDYTYSIVDQADMQQGWLEALGIRRVHLLAHDYGCSVAQELLARDQEGTLPFTVASVCFLNGGLFPEVHQPLLIQKLLCGRLGGLVSRALTRQVFDHNISKILGPAHRPTAAELDDFWQLLLYDNGRGILHRLIRFQEERRCHRHRWVGAMQAAPQPLRMVCGMSDPVSGLAMADRYRTLMPKPDVVLLEGVGHYPHYESPQQVYKAVTAFWKSID